MSKILNFKIIIKNINFTTLTKSTNKGYKIAELVNYTSDQTVSSIAILNQTLYRVIYSSLFTTRVEETARQINKQKIK